MPERNGWKQNHQVIQTSKADMPSMDPEDWRLFWKLLSFLFGVAGFVCWLSGADHVGYWLTFTAFVLGILQPWQEA
jgi:hypothetical protein